MTVAELKAELAKHDDSLEVFVDVGQLEPIDRVTLEQPPRKIVLTTIFSE